MDLIIVKELKQELQYIDKSLLEAVRTKLDLIKSPLEEMIMLRGIENLPFHKKHGGAGF